MKQYNLVRYNNKHNEANGEGNPDGLETNLSWNCGVEGPTDDTAVEQLRRRQVKNCIVILLISVGAPMLQMGDEMRRTQRGNNNAYCHDNEVSWLDWRTAPAKEATRGGFETVARLRGTDSSNPAPSTGSPVRA